MRVPGAALLVVAMAGLAAPGAAAEPPLVLERTIPLDGVSGRIDHMAADSAGRRLFVAELGNGSVDIVDLSPGGKAVQRIGGLREPQGVGYIAERDTVVVANAGDGSVRFFAAADRAALGTVELGEDADNVRIDPRTRHVVIGHGGGGLAVIDAAGPSRIGSIGLAGHPEGFQIDAESHRAFVNVPSARQIAVVDLVAGRQVAGWRIAGLGGNFPMALAGPGGPLAVAFRSPARLVLLDEATGAAKQRLAICGDADDVFFDTQRNRIYVSCGEGVVDVMQGGPQGFRPAGRIPTAAGARTSLFVPELDRLFVAARAGWLGAKAAILVLRPTP
jgi:hypothetical protein